MRCVMPSVRETHPMRDSEVNAELDSKIFSRASSFRVGIPHSFSAVRLERDASVE